MHGTRFLGALGSHAAAVVPFRLDRETGRRDGTVGNTRSLG
jgi:hypothetical protein